jgi:hypothetical protein
VLRYANRLGANKLATTILLVLLWKGCRGILWSTKHPAYLDSLTLGVF